MTGALTEQDIIDYYRSSLPSHLQAGAIHVPDPIIQTINQFGIDVVGVGYDEGGYSYPVVRIGIKPGYEGDLPEVFGGAEYGASIFKGLEISPFGTKLVLGDVEFQLEEDTSNIDASTSSDGSTMYFVELGEIDTKGVELEASIFGGTEAFGGQLEVDVKAIEGALNAQFNSGTINVNAEATIAKLGVIPSAHISIQYKQDPSATILTFSQSYVGQQPGHFSSFSFGYTNDIYAKISDFHDLETMGFNLSAYRGLVKQYVELGHSTFDANAIALKSIIGDPNNLLDPHTVTYQEILQFSADRVFEILGVSSDYDPSDHQTDFDQATADGMYVSDYPETAEEIVAALAESIEEHYPDGKVTNISTENVIWIQQPDGSYSPQTLNPAVYKMLKFDAEVSDALVNGTVISQTTEVINNADGSVVNQITTLVDDGQGNLHEIIQSELADGSIVPANGFDGTTFVRRTDLLDGSVTGISQKTTFVRNGQKFETEEFQEDPDANWSIKQKITNSDGTISDDSPTFVVPSSELLGSLQFAGGTVGGLLADHLAGDDAFKGIAYGAVLKTIGTHFGTFTAYLAAGGELEAAVRAALGEEIVGAQTAVITAEFTETLYSNLNVGVTSALSNVIVDELGEALGIDGTVGGEIFDVAAGTITTGIVSETFGMLFNDLPSGVYTGVLSGGFDWSSPFYDSGLDPTYNPDAFGPYQPNTTVGDYVQAQVFNALAAYAGNRLAGEVIEPESEMAALFGAAGSALGIAIGTGAGFTGAIGAAGLSISGSLATAFGLAGSAVPIIGTAIGAFVGTVVGTALGNVFSDDENPQSWASVGYDYNANEYIISSLSTHDGGDQAISQNMALSVINSVNNIIELSQGILRSGSVAPRIEIGWREGDFILNVGGRGEMVFSSAGGAITHAAFELMKGFDLVGGHAVVMRAWHNSEATNIYEFKEDLEVAEAFQAYLSNPTGILALMMDQPDSEAAQSWAAILKRAAELKLHLPHEKDLDGGWDEILRAQGVDPDLIPSVEGDTIILTDPVTGEETVIHHVIGPGYEIVRIEGTDGNDIIEVTVDGPSISYVDAGAGDDQVTGSEQADVIVGGAGDDIINGLGGNDWLHGGQGEDVINGGAGDDFVVGGFDDDVLDGGADEDGVHGSYGNDVLSGGLGLDFLHGGEGNDELHGSMNELDYLYGENGDDTVYLYGKNEAYGGLGNDTFDLNQGNGDNFIKITRGDGHDFVRGASGNIHNKVQFDTTIGINELFFQQSNDDLKILVLGENQSVTIEDFFASSNSPKVNIHASGVWYSATGAGSAKSSIAQQVAIDSSLSEQPAGQYNVLSDTVIAQREALSNFDDIWVLNQSGAGNPSVVVYQGTEGNDANLALALQSHRILYGKAGNDSLFSSNHSAYVHEYMYGDSGNDFISGGAGRDKLVGGLGDDSLYGSSHQDVLFGGEGDDHLDGGNGDDQLFGGSGNDYLFDDKNNNHLDGGDGNDTLIVVEGSNSLYGGAGFDSITGGSGKDTMYGGLGNDIMYGGAGDDWLHGGDGDDDIKGGAGDDTITGGDGVDIIDAGAGRDSVSAGSGDDIIVFNLIDNNSIENLIDGGEGSDTLRIKLTQAEFSEINILASIYSLNAFIQNNSSKPSFGTLPNIASLIALTLVGIEIIEVYVDDAQITDFFTANYFVSGDIIIGTAQADTLEGFSGSDVVQGGNGNDVILGHASPDELHGESGNDEIYGGDGEDKIYGGIGNDQLFGDEDNDEIFGGDGSDAINGGAGNDIIDGESDGDTISGGDGDDNIDGGAGDDQLNAGSGNDIVNGGLGNDVIYGGLGNDTLNGDEGHDQLIGGAGNDAIWGGGGVDTAAFSGVLSNYIITEFSNYITVEDTSGSEGVDQIYNDVEILKFSDGYHAYSDFGTSSSAALTQDQAFVLNPVTVNTLAGSSSINLNTFSAKTMAVAFETGSDVTSRQVIYEQGGGSKGLNIFVENQNLYVAVWNYYSGVQWGYKEVSSAIDVNAKYTASFIFDGNAGTLTGYLNGSEFAQETGLGLLYGHGDDVGIGMMKDASRFHNTNYNGNGFQFTGNIEKIAQYNSVLSGSEFDQLNDYVASDWLENTYEIDGTAQNDVLNGTIFNDVISGEKMDDTLFGGAGDDILQGGSGIDLAVFSGIYSDYMITEVGNTLSVQALNSNEGTDIIYNDVELLKFSDGYHAFAEFGASASMPPQQDQSFLLDPVTVNTLPDNSNINSIGSYYTAKTMTSAFETGSDVTSRQVIYEQGGGSKGLNIFVESGQLYVAAWDYSSGSNWGYKTVNVGIEANTKYTSSFVFDGVSGTLTGYLNGNEFGVETGLGTLSGSGNDIGVGMMKDASRFHGTNYHNNGFEFIGNIEKLVQYNAALSGSELDQLNDYAAAGWLSTTYEIEGTIYGDAINGTALDDTISGLDGNDILNGRLGVDDLYGGEGADIFMFDTASALNNIDIIKDFDVSDGDSIDISDLLSAYDPLNDAITDFIQITDSGANSILSVDLDGGGDNFVQIAEVQNVIGLTDEDQLVVNNTILV